MSSILRRSKKSMAVMLTLTLFLVGIFSTRITEAATTFFYNSGVYYKVTSTTDKTVSIYASEGANSSLVIPETISNNGITYTVTAFMDNSFAKDKTLRDITIPATISVIDNAGFSNCNLNTATLLSNDIEAVDFSWPTVIRCNLYSQTEETASMSGCDIEYIGVVFETPEIVSATAQSGSEINLTWNGDVGPGYYEVYRSTSLNGTYTLVGTTYPCTYTDTYLMSNTTYYYKVCKTEQPEQTLFRSEFSNIMSATTTSTYPNPIETQLPGNVANLQATAIGNGDVSLSWDYYERADAYFIYCSDEPMETPDDGWITNVVTGANTTTYIDGGMEAGEVYYYMVVAAELQQNHTYLFSGASNCAMAVVR